MVSYPLNAIGNDMLKTSRKALNQFDEAAQKWGYQDREGWGSSRLAAQLDYELSRSVLVDRINHLEQTAKELRVRLLKARESGQIRTNPDMA